MKIITFFNNKGGVGKTTTVYHISWMLSELGHRVLAVDLDPQSNLSSMFLTQERMEEIVLEERNETILDAIIPVSEGEPYQPVHIETITPTISLLIGNLALSAFEDKLSDAWTKCLAGDLFGFKVTSLFKSLIDDASQQVGANFVLIDVGPNLGAINRAVLISTDYVVLPVASDLFSLQGIKNLGKTLSDWHNQWEKRKNEYPKPDKSQIPAGKMLPVGYVILQYSSRDSRPVKSYIRWADRIPEVYQTFVLRNQSNVFPSSIEADLNVNCLAMLKHYRSLAPMSMEAHKPMFLLKPADGAIGAHYQAVQKCYMDFKDLTNKIIERVNAN
ncbi:ParA family protein [Larkinella punicea]|uniref:ParA family protein n=1 Tax=Larkinella punicea TaxID=2315727 RepID=A0A368JF79_9BACT|nr:AAA family ATPase [Larkinella punicea]RCR66192.1 ParA family protein [Larkinella punicea]